MGGGGDETKKRTLDRTVMHKPVGKNAFSNRKSKAGEMINTSHSVNSSRGPQL